MKANYESFSQRSTRIRRNTQEAAPSLDEYALAGEVINGRFRMLRLLDCGGMGELWIAEEMGKDRMVVVKLIKQEFAKDESFAKRFKSECEAIKKCEHENIVPFIDQGFVKGRPAIVMLLIDGSNLQEKIDQQPLAIGRVRQVLRDVGKALSSAHQQNVIHRDIKPDNVLITDDWDVYLADFGLALIADQPSRNTLAGDKLGSAMFISPEQLKDSREVTQATDQWSLAATAVAMMTGTWTRDKSVIFGTVLKPFTAVLERALANDPNCRYPSISDFVVAFEGCCNSNPSGEPELYGYSYSSRSHNLSVESGKWFDDEKFEAMTLQVQVGEVKRLILNDTGITDRTLKIIGATFSSLRVLAINGCQRITHQGLQHLVNCESLTTVSAQQCTNLNREQCDFGTKKIKLTTSIR